VQENRGQDTCLVCESAFHPRTRDKSASWCYLLAAICLYFPANILPVMNMKLFANQADYTVVGGILFLWDDGDYVPAIIVFAASMIVPVLKIIILLYLLLSCRSAHNQKQRTTIYRWVKTIGRWSMVDVFVLGVLVALGQMGVVATIEPKPGAVAFCGVVLCTMMAANTFQPWWIWKVPKPEIEETSHAYGT
jgi:paraquat-inducible protein A